MKQPSSRAAQQLSRATRRDVTIDTRRAEVSLHSRCDRSAHDVRACATSGSTSSRTRRQSAGAARTFGLCHGQDSESPATPIFPRAARRARAKDTQGCRRRVLASPCRVFARYLLVGKYLSSSACKPTVAGLPLHLARAAGRTQNGHEEYTDEALLLSGRLFVVTAHRDARGRFTRRAREGRSCEQDRGGWHRLPEGQREGLCTG